MYERILRIRPNDKQVIFHRAWWLIEIPHRRQEAIEALRELLESSPHAFGFFLLGNALQMEGRHEEAIQAFETAESTHDPSGPHAPDFYFNWGKSLIALRRREEAAQAFRRAALLKPSDVNAWRLLGLIFIELGQWTDGVACQERVMRLEPSATHGLDLGGRCTNSIGLRTRSVSSRRRSPSILSPSTRRDCWLTSFPIRSGTRRRPGSHGRFARPLRMPWARALFWPMSFQSLGIWTKL